jgi:hypothetical protein
LGQTHSFLRYRCAWSLENGLIGRSALAAECPQWVESRHLTTRRGRSRNGPGDGSRRLLPIESPLHERPQLAGYRLARSGWLSAGEGPLAGAPFN